METTAHRADQAKAAAERLLHTVNHLRRRLRRARLPHETPADLRTGWAVQFKLLRKQIEAEKAVLTPEYLAGLMPTGSYPVDAEYAAPTASAAALALACRVYRVLGDTMEAMGMMPPPDLTEAYAGEPERGLHEWLESTDQVARYWQAVVDAIGKLETGRDLRPALEREGGACPPPPVQRLDAEQMMAGVLLAAAGDDAPIRVVMAIAHDKTLTAEQKMVKILLDSTNRRFEAFTSEQWHQLLGVSGQAIRGTDAWSALKEVKRTGQTFAQVWMHRE